MPLEQRPHPVDNGARTPVVLDDVGKDRPNLVEVRRCTLQEQLRRLGIAQDRAERLIDLVCQCGRKLAHHRHAADVRDLLPQELRLPFRLVALDLGPLAFAALIQESNDQE